jgi:hypothetical protein
VASKAGIPASGDRFVTDIAEAIAMLETARMVLTRDRKTRFSGLPGVLLLDIG